MPFVFGTVGKNGNPRFTGDGPDALHLAGQMMDAWIGFAKTGDPSHAAIGRWPAYGSSERRTMIFDRHCRAEAAPFEEERAIWDAVLAAT